MSYQKPVNPQRFDERVYEQLNPQKKAEEKRTTGIQRQQQRRGCGPIEAKEAGRHYSERKGQIKTIVIGYW
jgi:hypothetical protein